MVNPQLPPPSGRQSLRNELDELEKSIQKKNRRDKVIFLGLFHLAMAALCGVLGLLFQKHVSTSWMVDYMLTFGCILTALEYVVININTKLKPEYRQIVVLLLLFGIIVFTTVAWATLSLVPLLG